MARNKIARKALVGDSFPLAQTHVETTQVVCSQAHDREGGKQSGLDRPCIQTGTKMTAGSSKQQLTSTKSREMAEKKQRSRHEAYSRMDNVQTGGQPCKRTTRCSRKSLPHPDRRAATHGMHLAARMQLTSRQQTKPPSRWFATTTILEDLDYNTTWTT